MKWWRDFWQRRVPDGTGEYRELVEEQLETTKRMTPVMRRLAPGVQNLPAEELAARMRRAFTERRPT